ncbi:MAG: hypothetical protein M1817_005516 [Caeruleum heppii]|nr:MAG: hypothetical protein M1817_005516 [Caeruleum heppii]
MEDPWFDGLSEEWVSQPRVSSPSLPSATPSASDGSSIQSNVSRSRIPRYKSRSQPSSKLSHPRANLGPLAQPRASLIKGGTEKDGHRNNGHPPSDNTDDNRSGLDKAGPATRPASRTISSSTIQSTNRQQTTVQYRSLSSSPHKGRPRIEAQDWRCLLQDNAGYARPRDLFGPTGLENVFRAPPGQSPREARTQLASKIPLPDHIPSSPPQRGSSAVEEPSSWEPSLRSPEQDHFWSNRTPQEVQPLQNTQGEASAVVSKPKLNFCDIPEGEASVASSNNETPSPCVKQSGYSSPNSKSGSNLEEERAEELSPILITRRDTIDGRIDYIATPVPRKHRTSSHRDMSAWPTEGKQLDDGASSPESALRHRFSSSEDVEARHSVDAAISATSSSSRIARRGAFVTTRRGDQDSSIPFKPVDWGSSPPGLKEDSSLPRDESLIQDVLQPLSETRRSTAPSKEPSHQSPPCSPMEDPVTPTQTRKTAKPAPKAKSSASPLKLFSTHDTFTSQRLLQRLDQMEGALGEELPDHSQGSPRRKPRVPATVPGSGSECDADQITSPSHHVLRGRAPRNTRLASFGLGQLDEYQFTKSEKPHLVYEGGLEKDNSSSHDPRRPWRRRNALKVEDSRSYDYDSSADDGVLGTPESCMRRLSQSSRNTKDSQTIDSPADNTDQCHQPQKRRTKPIEAEKKRQSRSPVKDRQGKRRRTFQRSDFDICHVEENNAPSHQPSSQRCSIVGKKRKDAKYDAGQVPADPEVVARRRMLKPRTSSHRVDPSRLTSQRTTEMAHESNSPRRPPRQGLASDIEAKLDWPNAQAATVETQKSPLQEQLYDQRNGSLTTQDYAEEARKMMEFIRAQERTKGGLESTLPSAAEEESEIELAVDDVDSYQEAFSRPPSREGRPAPVQVAPRQTDPLILSHLQKYAEDQSERFISSSAGSLRVAGDGQADSLSGHPQVAAVILTQVESHPPGIRITQRQSQPDPDAANLSSAPLASAGAAATQTSSSGSNPSSGTSKATARTDASARSTTKRHIAPEMVSHLISDQVGDLRFNRANNTWAPSKSAAPSEADPFNGIPDLPTDDAPPLKPAEAAVKAASSDPGTQADNSKDAIRADRRPDVDEVVIAGERRPRTRGGPVLLENTSSALSRFSKMISSAPRVETRATSWGEEPKACVTPQARPSVEHGKSNTAHATAAKEQLDEDGIEEVQRSSPPHRRRDVTISFSSPLVSHVHGRWDEVSGVEFEISADGSQLDLEASAEESVGAEVVGSSPSVGRKIPSRGSRRFSRGPKTFALHRIHRIDEQDEDEVDHVSQRISCDLTILTPQREKSSDSLLQAYAAPGPPTRGHLSFHLSPLSEFTINQVDDSIVEHAQRVTTFSGGQALQIIHAAFPQATTNLVKRLTDVEPFEPYWEHLRRLNLTKGNLTSLCGLDHFCGRLQQLDVSDNGLCEMSGTPGTVRHLKVVRNSLSNLTSWHHLSNLQYLDISGNGIDSLKGLSSLVHLRALTADDNEISSLNDLFDMDGLISLRVRGNRLRVLDFAGTSLRLLLKLDVGRNQITDVRNLHCLGVLEQLSLCDNELSVLHFEHPHNLSRLRRLEVAGNHLERIDVSVMPGLCALDADRNRLIAIDGLSSMRHLDCLSMREQDPPTRHSKALNLVDFHEVQRLHLSANALPSFPTSTPFLNLQHLELASCALQVLPLEFGRLVPNLRVLNVNFNALKDLGPLRGIVRLRELSATGNRVGRLRNCTQLLSALSSLQTLDLRNNPLTIGFYNALAEAHLSPAADQGEEEHDWVEPYALPAVEPTFDDIHRHRLDPDTRLRRKVYEMLVRRACPSLTRLDGLPCMRDQVEASDGLWNRLMMLGVAKEVQTGAADDGKEACLTVKDPTRMSEREEVTSS